eukprot:PhM_4_TR15243/c0_g1_i1/m.59417/K03932/lpqC; polyhydroxybutyrate depolymerase
MRRLFSHSVIASVLLSLLLVDAACPAKQGYANGNVTQSSVKRPEGTRNFLVYVPSNYTNTKPVPLIFAFHGLTEHCDEYIDKFRSHAESRGFILISPCGSQGILGTAWNSGTCCGFSDDTHPDDVQLTRDITADVSSKLCIDSDRLYASGFSNGAMMAEVLACEASDLFRAVVSVSGITEPRPGNDAGLSRCDKMYAAGKHNTGVLNVHGTADIMVPYTGNAILGFPTVPVNMQSWVARNNCTSKNSTTTLRKGTFTNYVWSGCGAQQQRHVELVKNDGGAHTWPSTSDFDTTDYAIRFMLDRN